MRKILLIFGLMVGMMSAMVQGAMAKTTMEQATVVVKDTMWLAVDSILPEPDPNNNLYVFSFWGTESQRQQRRKVQIEYTSTSMYGTFTNDDFYNWDGSHGSGSFNYIRNMAGDQFYAFKNELTATVADSLGATVIHVNGLINVWGNWTRVLFDATIPAAAPDDTVAIDLGIASVIPNTFYNYLVLTAANEDYSLATGILGAGSLAPGTYYMADMLRPDFVTAAGDTILPAAAELTVTDAEEAGLYNLVLSLLSKDNILYEISMHTGRIAITDTIAVNCNSGQLSYSEVYDMFQFYGENEDYIIALSVTTGVLQGQVTDIPKDSIMLTFCTVGDKQAETQTHIFDATAHIEYDPSNPYRFTVTTSLYGTDGVLYEAMIPIGWSIIPPAADTVNVDCGEGVIRVDYSRGLGLAGLVLSHQVGEEVRSANVVFYAGGQLTGEYVTEDFDFEADNAMYVQRVWVDHSGRKDTIRTYSPDIKMAQMQIDSIGDTIHITLDAYAYNDTLYHFTAWMGPKDILTGDEKTYDISASDECTMLAYRQVNDTTHQQLYQLQFQRVDSMDTEGYIVGNAEIWSFYFLQQGWDGIKGNYGYSEGNLWQYEVHTAFEGNTEIILAPVAGTLDITPISQMRILVGPRQYYNTWIYSIESHFVAENGILYHLGGENLLFCINVDTETLDELTEEAWTAIEEALDKEGLRVKKVLRGGMILLETKQGTFDLGGRKF